MAITLLRRRSTDAQRVASTTAAFLTPPSPKSNLFSIPHSFLVLVLVTIWCFSHLISNSFHICFTARKLDVYCISGGTGSDRLHPIDRFLRPNTNSSSPHQPTDTREKEIADAVKVVEEKLRTIRSWASNSSTSACGGTGGGGVYVYDLPSKFNKDLLARCHELLPWADLCDYFSNDGMGLSVPGLGPGWHRTHQYSLEPIFHSRVLRHPCRVTDPTRARLFYVPFYAGLDVLRWHFVNASGDAKDALGAELVHWLEARPEWARRGGVDHMFVLGKISWDFRRAGGESWGSSFLSLPQMQAPYKFLIERQPWEANEIGVPHPTHFHPRSDEDVATWQARVNGAARVTLVSFAGAGRQGSPAGSIREALIKQCSEAAAAGNAPPGDSPTRKSVFDGMVAGCIPVLFDPFTAYYQYPWHLPKDHRRYSIYVEQKEVTEGRVDVVERLKAVTPAEREEMRRYIIYELMPGLVYGEAGGEFRRFRDAFEIVMGNMMELVSKESGAINAEGGTVDTEARKTADAMATAMLNQVASEREREVELDEEDGDGGCQLDTKRGRGLGFRETNAEVGEGFVAGVNGGEECRSVYFDEAKGTESSSSDEADSRLLETDHFVVEKQQQNLNAEHTGILDDIQSILVAQEKQNERDIKVENCTGSHHGSVQKGEAEITYTEPETKNGEFNVTVKVVKLGETELDLEKVLEEQETYDLLCPNCRSCITRRVILRKRKRSIPDISHVERPEKQQSVEPDDSAASAGIAEKSPDNEPDVFRCLSCFSIFIPTGNGFNIFRVFRKREEGVTVQTPCVQRPGQTPEEVVTVQVPSVQHPGQMPARNENWFYSFFKLDSTWKTGTAAAAQAPVVQSSCLGDKKFEQSQSNPARPLSEPAKVGTSSETNGTINGAAVAQLPLPHEVLPVVEYLSGVLPLSEATKHGEVHAPNKHKVPAARVPVEVDNSSLGDQKFEENLSTPALPLSEPAKVGTSYETAAAQLPVLLQFSSVTEYVSKDVFSSVIPSSETVQVGEVHAPSKHQIPAPSTTVFVPQDDVPIHVPSQILVDVSQENRWEVLKSIVYGGLVESITSLGIVSSTAGAETSTLKIVAIGVASLFGGFFVLLNDLSELKNSAVANEEEERTSRYWKLLGRRSNFGLHVTVAIASYILFGLLPPIIYGFSFRESDNKEHKLIAVASASLLCISLLAVGKARTSEPRSYIKTLLYYLGLGFTASGISFVAGVMISRFLEQLGLFEHDSPVVSPPSIQFLGASDLPSWAYK
ncbi:hypothetical protein HPP92_025865 [Vanilla planifolia]|uniref:Exostosin GT47 domain-containing protein n=1 Tax=Vanilla planifolia TaxID=51239 RepID=A0A835PG57_VANPL|nr:hypothetical protein HPP92_025865 [Vanilla planifolia]